MAAIALAAAIGAGTTPASAATLPDDPDLPQAWVTEIAAPDAWQVTTGDPAIVVAVVDTGVDVSHPDLAPNAWRNGAEVPNGADDDGDGLVDDVGGWSFGRDNGDVADASGHGTHVAGLVAARGANGIGTAGVCWTCTVLPVDVYREGARGTLRDLANGMEYAAARARIVNLSLESPVSSPELAEVVTRHPDRLFVVAAGNGGRDVDAAPSYPCAIEAPNLVCVTADDGGSPAEAANWGARSVDLAAPGVGLVSTAPGGGTSAMTGSSFSAPLVAGTAALLWSWRPDASVEQVRAALVEGADRLPGWAGRTASGGRLNAFGALGALAMARGESLPAAPSPVAPVTASAASSSLPATATPPPPLAVPSARGTLRRGVLTVRLFCRSRVRSCSGTLRAGGRSRSFAIRADGARAVRLPLRARRSTIRVAVRAGARRRAFRVRLALRGP